MYNIEEDVDRLILVAVATNNEKEVQESLEELEELSKTAGCVVVAKVVQNRESVHPGTYIGKGKIEEVALLIDELNATTIVCDDELSPAQIKNLEQVLHVKIIDRTVMILDIFAARACTSEGKIQVELAQLRYRSSRLTGMGVSLSRLGGGIGTRGPGEKKLETDRRLIKDRISQLKKELDDVVKVRENNRNLRKNNHMPVIAIVGYTNAGKSTLLNKLTDAGVLEEDKLFATLDPTTRNFKCPNGQEILFTDTVGFIRKLPHHLIDAFKSTLEEAKYADIILHVVDSSNEQADSQMHIVYDTLKKLDVCDKPVITVFNKIDKENADLSIKDLRSDRSVYISAKKETGLDELIEILQDMINKGMTYIQKVYPYNEAGKIQAIRKYGQIIKEEYVQEGIYVEAYAPKQYA
ncbi:MAG: GTPase HflX [Lachnospiraceae bacterium]|nr:GTPase HflX [Lachnospiraceae bacterium]